MDERGGLQEAFNVRLDELKVVDLAFLGGWWRGWHVKGGAAVVRGGESRK
jgi:hypothetical protein